MTLRDLWLIIRHYAKWVVVVPILCALLAGGFMLAKESARGESYTAKATLTVTDPSGLLSSASLSNLANAVAQNIVSLNADASATAKADATTQSIDFTATGASADDAVSTVNAIAYESADAIQVTLAQQGDAYWDSVNEAGSLGAASDAFAPGTTSADRVAALKSCVFTVAEASAAAGSGSSNVVKYAVVGLLGGLFAVGCALVLVDAMRRPLKTKDNVRECTDAPVLAQGATPQDGERLWANVQFASEEPVGSVGVVPVSAVDTQQLCGVLKTAMEAQWPQAHVVAIEGGDLAAATRAGDSAGAVLKCAPLADGMAAAYGARAAQATIVVARTWKDSQAALCDTLKELQLAGGNVVGIVLVD